MKFKVVKLGLHSQLKRIKRGYTYGPFKIIILPLAWQVF
jgi:hypothetical protein